MGYMFHAFRIPVVITAAIFILLPFTAGPAITLSVLILVLLELTFSFDNAVVNAKVLSRMSPFWQRLFLTLGIFIAVFGMRLVFPLLIVSIAGNLGPIEVLNLAVNSPEKYEAVILQAHPAIAAFGGIFLLMLFLDFIFEDRRIKWLVRLENALASIGRLENLTVIISLFTLALVAATIGHHHASTVLLAGVTGMAVYLSVTSLTKLFDIDRIEKSGLLKAQTAKHLTQAGLFGFIYLEVLDASFSFDAVVGAFAVSNQILVIALGLGIGALFVRSLTIYLVREGTLARYVYLEHGAHYGIGVLAVLLLITIGYEIPQVVIGLAGIFFIVIAFLDSRAYLRRHPKETPLSINAPQ